MDYTLIISVCSILVMFFSAYVAYKSYKLQIDVRKPRLIRTKRKHEFQYYIKDGQFHLTRWLINTCNVGGETAVVDCILFSIKINQIMYMGKVDSTNFKSNIPSGAPFIVDLSYILDHNNTWNLKEEENEDGGKTVGIHITEISCSEAVPMMLYDIPDMSYRALIQYRLNGTDATKTQPYGLIICGVLEEDR